MKSRFASKDNEFIAWYPLGLRKDSADSVWARPPIAYYVHIPFCTAICEYCGFSVERLKGADIPRYLGALRKEIMRYAELGRLHNRSFACGHFGGGTPSVLEADELLAVKSLIAEYFHVEPTAEITVEVNPISLSYEKAKAYYDGGINRISVGVQSFNDRLLKIIGRPHRRNDVDHTLDAIRRMGWSNYSLDIMYGIPSQSLTELREDLLRTVDGDPSHISCFRLEIIPFTFLKLKESGNLIPPRLSTQMLDEMDDLVSEVLIEHGYRHYGAFNFARPGFESVHNLIAFAAPQGEYVGFGNSSYSFINGYIYCNHADIQNYEEAVRSGRDPIALAKKVNTLEAMSRFFVLGVKFFRVPRKPFVEQFGIHPEEVFGDILRRLQEYGLLIKEGDDYVLTRQGCHYVNNVCKEFYVGESRGRRQHVQFVPTLTPEQVEFVLQQSVPAAKNAADAATKAI